MHDSLDRAAVLRLDRHDVAAAALRDDRVLQQPGELRRLHEPVEPLLEPRLCGAQVGAERAQARAGAVEHLAGRADRVFDRAGDVGGRAGEARARRERRVGADVLEKAQRRLDRVRHGEKLLGIERPAEPRAPERVADVARPA